MLTSLLSRIIIIIFAVLHPAYKSYKSLRNKNQTQIVTWLMYWIVFALFTAIETITDIILCWLPFYYELKIIFVLWMSLSVTRGYSVIFRKIIHPELRKREPEIDEIIRRASEKSYDALLNFGAKGINFAASTVFSTAVKGHELLKTKSLSLGDLSFSHRRISESEPTNDTTDKVGYIHSISGQTDDSTSPLLRLKSNTGGYDPGSFPRRKTRVPESELQILPEEEASTIIESEFEPKKDKYRISQMYLSALTKKEQPKRPALSPFLRSQSESSSESRLLNKPPLYRPNIE